MYTKPDSVYFIYSQFEMPGIRPQDIELLFNTSNYWYFCNQVINFQHSRCPFCTIDEEFNQFIDIENDSWNVIRNTVSPRSGQLLQLVIPLKRHVESSLELTLQEKMDWWKVRDEIRRRLLVRHGIKGCAFNDRDGDPFFNAKSVRHFHFNLNIPSGVDKVQVTFGKTLKSRQEKLKQLNVFKKMFLMGEPEPWKHLTSEEFELVKDDIKPPEFTEALEI